MKGDVLINLFLVGFGGSMGAVARYAAGKLVAEKFAANLPLGTWVVNISGAFLLGFFLGISARWGMSGGGLGLLLGTGFLGAFTTFSTFSYEALLLIKGSEYLRALGYVSTTITFGLAAAWLGVLASVHFFS